MHCFIIIFHRNLKLTTQIYLLLASLLSPATGLAEIIEEDDRGVPVTLVDPATRVISFSPHITEMLYSIGAGDRIVATVEHSDYPSAARKLPRIGSATSVDMERILQLRPDLIIGWISGNRNSDINRIAQFGIATFMIEPNKLSDIPRHIQSIGNLLGVETTAQTVASEFTDQLRVIKSRQQNSHRPRVFYQIWNPPLMTLGATHIVSEAISLCGGKNIYADVNSLTATISIEDVLHRSPDVIIAGVVPEQINPLVMWNNYAELDAVKNKALFRVDANEMHRPTVRMLSGIKNLCGILDSL